MMSSEAADALEHAYLIHVRAILATVTSASGSGSHFTVADGKYFVDGWCLVEEESVRIQGQ